MKKSFRKSFQGFALLSSIFFKRNRIYFQLYTLQIIPCNQLRINLRRVNLSLAFPDPRIFHLYNGESLLKARIYLSPSPHKIHLSHLALVNLCLEQSVIPLSKYSPPFLNWLFLNKFLPDREIRRRASYVEGGGWRERRVAVYYVTFDRPRRAPWTFRKIYTILPSSFSESSVICRGSRQNCLSIVPLRPLVKVTPLRPPLPGN